MLEYAKSVLNVRLVSPLLGAQFGAAGAAPTGATGATGNGERAGRVAPTGPTRSGYRFAMKANRVPSTRHHDTAQDAPIRSPNRGALPLRVWSRNRFDNVVGMSVVCWSVQSVTFTMSRTSITTCGVRGSVARMSATCALLMARVSPQTAMRSATCEATPTRTRAAMAHHAASLAVSGAGAPLTRATVARSAVVMRTPVLSMVAFMSLRFIRFSLVRGGRC